MVLEGKAAIVPGGASGVGRAVAARFAAEGLDGTLALIRDAGGNAHGVTVDVSQPDSVSAMVGSAVQAHSGVDISVNSAAIARVEKVLDFRFESSNEIMSINLSGVFLCAQTAARYMRDHGGGRIINISSVNGQRAVTGRGAYSVAKDGLEMLTRIIAAELGEFGITVNSVAPATVDTDTSIRSSCRPGGGRVAGGR
jgi:NAD(P)-dependent dehydrogenase (short-subunit alcohol dehydrogenase family)